MNATVPCGLLGLLLDEPELDRAYLVGGGVRDWILGVPVKDFDVEVYGLSMDRLASVLSRHGRVDLVGKAFGVLKLSHPSGDVWDFSLPRRDSKSGVGHRGFEVEVDPALDTRSASARRDFTLNAMMWDPRRRVLVDHHGGESDLRARILRHTGPAFVEDPLRVLRGMQFCARFDLVAAPETVELCRSMRDSLAELPPERVREEWFKWAARSVHPSAGLRFLRDTLAWDTTPELRALAGIPQDPEWHPEGDVWTHTLHCVDALVRLPEWSSASESSRLVWMFAVLLHDTGKATHTREEVRDGRARVVSPGHESAGVPLALSFLDRFGCPNALRDRIPPLVANHMVHQDDPSDRMVRRLARRLAPSTIGDLCQVMTADASGRPPRPFGETAAVRALRSAASRLDLAAAAPAPILLGRHLLERGARPGPELGRRLAEAFEAQLDGEFSDLAGALSWVETRG